MLYRRMFPFCFTFLFCFSLVDSSAPLNVVHSSDAGADDFVTSCVLMLDERASVKGVIVTNADCVPEYALSAYGKLMRFMEMPVPFGLSRSKTWNQFPWHWRADTIRVDEIESFAPYAEIIPYLSFEGDDLLVRILKQAAPRSISLVATGPLSTLADVLRDHPSLQEKIRSLHWMGGAISVRGNIYQAGIHEKAVSDKAEWNVFADAFAADWLFKNTTFPIFLIPLDLTDHATITPQFLNELQRSYLSGYRCAGFVLQCYQAVCDLGIYSMWDVVTACALVRPELFEEPVSMQLKVITASMDHGALISEEGGREVQVFFDFKDKNPEPFRDYLLRLFQAGKK